MEEAWPIKHKKYKTEEYTDKGNLALTVGELFIKHIYDYDEGITLGGSYSKAKFYAKDAKEDNKASNPFKNRYNLMFGMHDKDGEVKATIGQGTITVEKNPEELEKANRDLYGIQKMFTNIDIIKLYYAEKYEEVHQKAVKELSETGTVGFFHDAAKATAAVSQEVLSMLTPKQNGIR